MDRMSRERMQQVWDYELLRAWDDKGRNKVWMVIKAFICKVYPDKEKNYFDTPFKDIIDLLSSTGIRRCLDADHISGIDTTFAFKSDVIGFIHGRCERMSMDLINGVPKPMILLDMGSYKWVKRDLNHNASRARKRGYLKLKDQANLKVKARDLSSTKWEVVSE